MSWVGTTHGAYWAADFRLSRWIYQVYARCGKPWPAVVVGLQGSGGASGLGPAVARELARDYATVWGGDQQPVGIGELDDVLGRIAALHPAAFVVVVQGVSAPAAGWEGRLLVWSALPDDGGEEEMEGLSEPGEGLPPVPGPPPASDRGHAHLVALAAERTSAADPAPSSVARLCDVAVDGLLRFFYRIGQLP